jgi:hypothetical protein
MGPLDDQVVRADSLTATPDGLDIAVYSHWYRALPLPSLVKADLTVDGERIDTSTLSVTVNGHRYSWAELAEKGDEYWFTTDPVVLHVPVDTAPGREHRVQLLLGLSIPYILTGPDRVPNVALTLDPECGRPASRRPGGDHRLRRLSPGPLAQDLEHESAGTAEQGGQAAHRRRRHLPRRRVLLRLASCVLIEAHDEWQVCDRRYLSEASMALLTPPQPAALDTRRPEPNEVIDQPALQTASSATPQSSTRTIYTAGHGPAARSQCWLHRQQQAERSWPGSPPRMAPYRRGNAPRAPPAQHRTARSHTEIGGTSQTPPSTTRSRRLGASPAETRPNLRRGTSGRDH